MKFILYIWQLPQNILGLLVILFTSAKKTSRQDHEVWVSDRFDFGVSLGKYIILGEKNYAFAPDTVLHEHGHQIQSIKYGVLYLIIVGLPSFTRNVWDRLFHKEWPIMRRTLWYYSGFPEKQADRLGGVRRFK